MCVVNVKKHLAPLGIQMLSTVIEMYLFVAAEFEAKSQAFTDIFQGRYGGVSTDSSEEPRHPPH